MVKLQVEAALTDSETLEEVINCLSEHLKIETQGACDQRTLFNILLKAASSGESIENTAKTLATVKERERYVEAIYLPSG